MTYKTTVLVNARSLHHHQKPLRGLPPQLLPQLKLRLQGENESMQIL
jgi:hypothetical protein